MQFHTLFIYLFIYLFIFLSVIYGDRRHHYCYTPLSLSLYPISHFLSKYFIYSESFDTFIKKKKSWNALAIYTYGGHHVL